VGEAAVFLLSRRCICFVSSLRCLQPWRPWLPQMAALPPAAIAVWATAAYLPDVLQHDGRILAETGIESEEFIISDSITVSALKTLICRVFHGEAPIIPKTRLFLCNDLPSFLRDGASAETLIRLSGPDTLLTARIIQGSQILALFPPPPSPPLSTSESLFVSLTNSLQRATLVAHPPPPLPPSSN
jgi:hypothetical protein